MSADLGDPPVSAPARAPVAVDAAGARRPDRSPVPRSTGAAVVFLASAAALVLEVVAIRLVAPYVGITLQTSSAVIGTTLSAMALGAWAGGRLADRRAPATLLGPLLLASGVLTCLTVPLVRQAGEWLRGGPDVTVVLVLALLAVFPPTALLSAVTPVVVTSQLSDLQRTGSVVGRLSGTATLGAITSTFLTGFVLISAFPTSDILLGTGVLLLLAGGVLARLRSARVVTAGILAALPLVPVLFLVSPDPCQVETEYHCVRVETNPAFPAVRSLRLDTLTHSVVDLADPRALAIPYVRAMAAVEDVEWPPSAPVSGLYVGGGGFTLPRYVAATRPGSSARVLEIDPGVVAVSRLSLGAGDVPATSVRTGDARTAVSREPAARYDLVVGDAFGGLAVPWHLTTREAVEDVHRVLRPGGAYLVNVIDHAPDSFARAELATLATVFRHVAVAAPGPTLAGTGGGNHVLIASDRPIPTGTLAAGLATAVPEWTLLDPAATARFAAGGLELSDDFAPVDQLLTR